MVCYLYGFNTIIVRLVVSLTNAFIGKAFKDNIKYFDIKGCKPLKKSTPAFLAKIFTSNLFLRGIIMWIQPRKSPQHLRIISSHCSQCSSISTTRCNFGIPVSEGQMGKGWKGTGWIPLAAKVITINSHLVFQTRTFCWNFLRKNGWASDYMWRFL